MLRLPLLLFALAAACAGSPPQPVPDATPVPEGTLSLDSLAFDPGALSDGGAVEMGEPLRSRLLASDPLWERALALHYDALVMDGHIDTPSLMLDDGYAFGERHEALPGSQHVDLPKMVEGGLDAPFFSIFVSRSFGETQAATDRALAMIAEAERQLDRLDGASLAYTADDVLRITRAGRKAVLMGLEGGHALQGSPEVLRQLHARGIRYVTLTHTNTNGWADSSQDAPRHDGLNALGERLVQEMNRLGVLVDVSHVSDATIEDALRVSRAPVIASHSSAAGLLRHPRNISDALLRAIAQNGGVVMVNFYDLSVSRHFTDAVMDAVYRDLEARGEDFSQVWNAQRRIAARQNLPRATVADVVDHIEHIIAVAGEDHVGLGSDFDGVPSLPEGLEDATRLPFITYELLKRGHSEATVRKILGGNTLRALAQAEAVAAQLQAAP